LDFDDNVPIKAQDAEDFKKKQKDRTRERHQQLKAQEEAKKAEEEQMHKDYMKMGGIQHIICSATMTID
jgi:hypothetical protein